MGHGSRARRGTEEETAKPCCQREVRLQCLVRWSEDLLALQTNRARGYPDPDLAFPEVGAKVPLGSPLHNRLQLVSSVRDTLPLQMICVSSQCDSLCQW